MVAVLLAVAALAIVELALRAGRVASGSALLSGVETGVVVLGSGLVAPMCGGARRRLELAADAP